MGIPIYFGTRQFGSIENPDGTTDATRFFHIYYLPLIPLGTYTFPSALAVEGGHRATPRGLRLASVGAAYLKAWGLVGVGALTYCAYYAIENGEPSRWALGLACYAALFGVIASWFFLGVRRPFAMSTTRLGWLAGIAAILSLGLAWPLTFAAREHDSRSHYSDPIRSDAHKAYSDAAKAYSDATRASRAADAKVEAAQRVIRLESDCARGNRESCNNFGVALLSGTGITKNETRAVEQFERACELHDATACTNAAICYQKGTGVPVDARRALALDELACNAKLAKGCARIATTYRAGAPGIAKNATKEKAYQKKACALDPKLLSCRAL